MLSIIILLRYCDLLPSFERMHTHKESHPLAPSTCPFQAPSMHQKTTFPLSPSRRSMQVVFIMHIVASIPAGLGHAEGSTGKTWRTLASVTLGRVAASRGCRKDAYDILLSLAGDLEMSEPALREPLASLDALYGPVRSLSAESHIHCSSIARLSREK